MQKSLRIIKKYPLSLLCIALIWYLSLLIDMPETPFDDVQFIDKWTHLVMYGGTCSVIWGEHLRNNARPQWGKLIVFACGGLVVLGGIIELLQEHCTTTRSGEWLDFGADAAGVFLGNAAGLLLWGFLRRKGSSGTL